MCAAESFATTDQQYLAADGNQNKDDGCTAVAAVLIGNRLVVANVGDSRAVLSRNSQGEFQTDQTSAYCGLRASHTSFAPLSGGGDAIGVRMWNNPSTPLTH